MDPAAPHSGAPLSLQDKLDRISHERKVLDVLRELTRIGLHEGDELQHRSDGTAGRLFVLRASAEPGPVVVLGDGAQIPFRSGDWRPRS